MSSDLGHTPCALVIQVENRCKGVEEHTEKLTSKTEKALTDIRKSFESFQKWLLGIIIMSVFLSVTGGLWKITDEFKDVREAIHLLDKKISKINMVQ